MSEPEFEELHAYPPRTRVTWTGLGLVRDARGNYIVKCWDLVEVDGRGTYYRNTRDLTRWVHRSATPEDIDTLTVVRDNLRPPDRTCERCGTVAYLEQHHWAPRHLFGDDADTWPTADLCQPCHREWHRIVTPDMAKRKAS